MLHRRGKVLALVLAGGAGGRLDPLTRERPKPALPFGGVYRLIDFPLSNCHHSRISDVWVLQQYEAHTLSEYLSNGRPWDLDRTYGGLRIVHPYLGDEESGWYEGNADAIHRNREAIARFDPEIILTLSADAVYRLDYGAVVDEHLERQAEVTIVTTAVARGEENRFAVVEVSGDGRVTGFAYKPDEPRGNVVATEVFVYDASILLTTLAELAQSDEELSDFGNALLPRFVARGRAFAADLGGYWRDVGTIQSYWQTHMDLLADEPRLRLDDPHWPILTRAELRPPAAVSAGASVEDARLSPGCVVRGRVVRSVLGPGVVVERGAEVVDSVVLEDARITSCVQRAVVDARVDVTKPLVGDDDVIVR